MAENEVSEHSNRKQIRQPPSVPFLWEVKPGIPKKDWTPEVSSVTPLSSVTPPLPVKLVASVPFNWEEKPGKPLPCFSQLPLGLASPPTPPANLITFSPPANSQGYADDNGKDVDGRCGGDADDEQEGILELDPVAFGFETDDLFSSAPSLLANCLLSSMAISRAVPVEKTSPTDNISGQLETPSSPASETDSSTSSYATGTSSLVGASFLECLFPLYPPNSGFLGKVGHSEKGSLTALEVKSKDFDGESNCSVVARRTPTLGELMMMSRRRSYRRKAECNMTGSDEKQSFWMLHFWN